MATLNLKFSECGYGGRRDKVDTKNEVFEYLIDQLRQLVNNSQREDLAREVQSLKNQLRDMSELVDELMRTITLMSGDVEAYKRIREQEQSGRRKEYTQECKHEWCAKTLYGTRISPTYCRKCGLNL